MASIKLIPSLVGCVPRTLRSAPRLRRGALLMRGPSIVSGAWVPVLRRSAKEPLHRARDTRSCQSQRRIDRFVVFLFEPRDQFGGGHDLADAADALAAAPDLLPGLRFCPFTRCIRAKTHPGGIRCRQIFRVHAGSED